MKKNVIFLSALAFILTVILGFNFINKDKIVSPFSSYAPNQSDKIVSSNIGPVYNLDDINAIWTESFDGTTYPPTGWVQIQESGTATWARVTAGTYPVCAPHSGAGMVGFNSWTASTGVSSLVSAVFSLTSGQAKLGFWMYRDSGYPTDADLVNYLINTVPNSTGATLLGTINRSKTLAPIETGPDGWYFYEFTIPASFNTATNYIILQASSAYGNDCYVDDVSVNLLLAHDAGVQSIDVASTISGGSVSPKATVKNFGTSAETFPVLMTITPGGYTNTQTVTNLAAGGTLQVTFSNWAATGGTYTIKVISQLGTDLNRTNDTLVKTVTVVNGLPNCGWTSRTSMSPRWAGGTAFLRKGTYPNDTGIVYHIGGADAAFAFSLTAQRFNTRTNVWDTVAPVPTPMFQTSAITAQGKIYLPEGYSANFVASTVQYVYNPATNSWTSIAPLPTPVGDAAIGVYGDSLIYVVGGYSGSADQNLVQVYNIRTNTWSQATPKPGAAASGIRCGIAGNKIVVVGGYSQTLARELDSVYVGTINPANPLTITWGPGAIGEYPGGALGRHAGGTPIGAASTGLLSTRYVLFTAGDPTGAGTAVLTATWAFDALNNVWLQLPNKITGVSNVCNFVPVTRGDTLFAAVYGGYNGASVIGNAELICLGVGIISGVGNETSTIPTSFSLSQNYPNPFNPVTKINYSIPKAGIVTMKVYDIIGRQVANLVNDFKNAGNYSIDFNGENLSSGVYFYSIEVNGFKDIKKMVLIK